MPKTARAKEPPVETLPLEERIRRRAYELYVSSARDADGNKISETDALNHTTTYAYDNANRLILTTYPDNKTVSYTYDFRGKTLTITDELSRVTKNVYD